MWASTASVGILCSAHRTSAQELKDARAEAAQQQDRVGSGVEASSSGSGEDSDGSQDVRRRRSKKRGRKGKDAKEGRRTREERRKPRPDGKKAKKRGREDKAETKVSSCAAGSRVVQLQAGTLTHGACRSQAPAQMRLASTVSCVRRTWTGVTRVSFPLPGRGLCL